MFLALSSKYFSTCENAVQFEKMRLRLILTGFADVYPAQIPSELQKWLKYVYIQRVIKHNYTGECVLSLQILTLTCVIIFDRR